MKRCKLLSIFLVMLLVTTMVTPNVQAAVKLNKSKATIYVGETLTLKISGTKNKVTWSTSNKKIATVSSNGKVSAKAKGTATITAKVNNKKYDCKITVKPKFNADNASKNLKCKYFKYYDGVIAIVKNNYDYTLNIDATAIYYNDEGQMLDKSSADNYCLAKGDTCVFHFAAPLDGNYENIAYDTCKVNYKCEQASATSVARDLELSFNDGSDNVMVEVKNKGKKAYDFATIEIVFYKDGKVIGYDSTYANCEQPGTSDFLKFDYPYDENYETVIPDDYDIYIHDAYYYNW